MKFYENETQAKKLRSHVTRLDFLETSEKIRNEHTKRDR